MGDRQFDPQHLTMPDSNCMHAPRGAENYGIIVESISKADVLSNLEQLDRSQLIDLLFRQRDTIRSLEERLTNERSYLMQQLSQMTDNYNCMRYRHKLKEIRVQEVMAQLKQLKENHAPCYNRLRGCLMDPGVNRIFEKMKEQIEEHKRAKEDALNDMQAWTFTSESQAGKRLVARCKKLLQENEEFGKQVTSGNVAKLNTEIEMYKRCIQEMRDKENEYDSLLVEMDEELDAVTCLCKTFEYKLHTKGLEHQKADQRSNQTKRISNEINVCSGDSKIAEKCTLTTNRKPEGNTKTSEPTDSEFLECKYEFVELHVPCYDIKSSCTKEQLPLKNIKSVRKDEISTSEFEKSNTSLVVRSDNQLLKPNDQPCVRSDNQSSVGNDRSIAKSDNQHSIDRSFAQYDNQSSKIGDRSISRLDNQSSKASDRSIAQSDSQSSKPSDRSNAQDDFTNSMQCNEKELKRSAISKTQIETPMNSKPVSARLEGVKMELIESREEMNVNHGNLLGNKLANTKHKVKISDAYKDDSASFGPDQISSAGKTINDGTYCHAKQKDNKSFKDSGKIEGCKNEILKKHKKRNVSSKEHETKSYRMGGAVDIKQAGAMDKMFRSRDDAVNENRQKRSEAVVPTNNERREPVRYKLSRSPRQRRKLSRSSRSRENRTKARRMGPSPPPRYRSDYRGAGNGRRRSSSRSRR